METNKISISIRAKVMLTIFASTAILAACIYFIANDAILKSYSTQENKSMLISLNRTNNLFLNAISEFKIKLKDWSNWDDTYVFVNDKNKAFIDSNLGDASFTNLGLNTMVFINDKGEIIYNKLLNIDSNIEISSDELASYIKDNLNLFRYTDLNKSFSGIIPLKEGNLLVVSAPILKSNGEGPVAGSIIFGKFINDKFINNISSLTQLSVSLYPYDFSTSTEDLLNARNNLTKDNKYYISTLSTDIIAGYFILNSVNNNPVSIVKVVDNRDIYEQGKNAFIFFIWTIIIAAILFSIMTVSFLQIVVVSRIHHLNNEVFDITEKNDISKRIRVDQSDEIGSLIVSINKMLDDLYSTQKNERDLIEKERSSYSKLKEKAEELTNLNKLMVGRELKMIELKKKINDLKIS